MSAFRMRPSGPVPLMFDRASFRARGLAKMRSAGGALGLEAFGCEEGRDSLATSSFGWGGGGGAFGAGAASDVEGW
nr:hypothetical protein Iba_chr03bCG18180 [Ipomoea batatas]GMC78108.1 hypothetical protein Iba_chr03fCG4860 [Ipomoea batatas]